MKKNDRDFPMLEPILIFDPVLGNWQHPDIEEIVSYLRENYEQPNEGVNSFMGPLIRFVFEDTINIIVMVDPNYYVSFLESDEEAIEDIVICTEVCLLEDVWMPGNEQFAFTEYGRSLAKRLEGKKLEWLSPDVGITGSGTEWWFDT